MISPGLIQCKRKSPFVRITGTLNQHKCMEILKLYLLPFKAHSHSGTSEFIDQHGGCGLYRAKNVSLFFEEEGIAKLPWPAQSSELSSIENVLSAMKHNLRKLRSYFSTADDVFSQFYFIWDILTNDLFIKFIESMKAGALLYLALELELTNME